MQILRLERNGRLLDHNVSRAVPVVFVLVGLRGARPAEGQLGLLHRQHVKRTRLQV